MLSHRTLEICTFLLLILEWTVVVYHSGISPPCPGKIDQYQHEKNYLAAVARFSFHRLQCKYPVYRIILYYMVIDNDIPKESRYIFRPYVICKIVFIITESWASCSPLLEECQSRKSEVGRHFLYSRFYQNESCPVPLLPFKTTLGWESYYWGR